jgi:hypothetical protein
MACTKTLAAFALLVHFVAPPLARADALPSPSSSPANEVPPPDPLDLPPTPDIPADDTERAPRWHLTGGMGGFSTDQPDRGGVVLDFLGLRRVGPFAFGLDVQLDFDGLRSESGVLAPALGVFAPTSRSFDVGIIAMAGVRNHHAANNGLFSDDPGANGTTGMFALRTITAVCFGRLSRRFSLGLSLFLDDDLARTTTPTYTHTHTNVIGESPPVPVTTSHRIGTFRAGALLAMGATF